MDALSIELDIEWADMVLMHDETELHVTSSFLKS
jgi:hypothetical protein